MTPWQRTYAAWAGPGRPEPPDARAVVEACVAGDRATACRLLIDGGWRGADGKPIDGHRAARRAYGQLRAIGLRGAEE